MTELGRLETEGRPDALADLDFAPTAHDVVIAVSASGRTRFALGALEAARAVRRGRTLGDTDWGAIMAGSVIYTLPVFILLRKHLMRGTTAGAMKG